MRRNIILVNEFVEYIPKEIKEGVLYISMKFGTVVHKCCCGCGNEIVTPLSPIDWRLAYDGEAVSLSPSIGNWHLKCKSHYWITNNRVEWATKWSGARVGILRHWENLQRKKYYGRKFDKG